MDLTEVLQQLQREGYLLEREDVACLSPYLTSHIKRFGDYLIDMEAIPRALDEQMLLLWRAIVTNLYIALNFTRISSFPQDGPELFPGNSFVESVQEVVLLVQFLVSLS